ncbi:MAG: hypothetical protein MI866_07135 [Bacteroidales bacterium]|nr:hypothetical protein [Bacteroidales bacterium]
MNKYMILISSLLFVNTILNAQSADEEIIKKGRYIYSLPDMDLGDLNSYIGETVYIKDDQKLYEKLKHKFITSFGNNYPRTVINFKVDNNGLLIDAKLFSKQSLNREKVYAFLKEIISEQITVEFEINQVKSEFNNDKSFYLGYSMRIGK